ncbi:MAG: hypothetical protein MUF64_13590 [Polyangiaceae bacterium]|jgi:hypothetical protein|nr:hypothetical protein [Polyangiaceae bacterium]
MSIKEWEEQRKQNREVSEARERAERAASAYQDCLERKAQAPSPPKPSGALGPVGLSRSCEQIRDDSMKTPAQSIGLSNPAAPAPFCGVQIPVDQPRMISRIAGRNAAKIEDLIGYHRPVVAVGSGGNYLAEFSRVCGSVRVELPRSVLGPGGGSGVGFGFGGGRTVEYAYPRTGSIVTWPDGSVAGTVAESGKVETRELQDAPDGRRCRREQPFAEPLCHAREDLCTTPGCKPGR